MLYDLLAKCYAKYEDMCEEHKEAKKMREELKDYITFHSISVNSKSHTLNRIVKCVFGADRRRVSAYSIVLRTAHFNKLKAVEIADFIRNNGGVEEIRLAKNGTALSVTKKAEVAKTVISSKSLKVFSSEKIAQNLDAANVGQQVVFLATQQANGKFTVNAVTNSTTAVNAALAAYYSANKADIANGKVALETASNDEILTNIVLAEAA